MFSPDSHPTVGAHHGQLFARVGPLRVSGVVPGTIVRVVGAMRALQKDLAVSGADYRTATIARGGLCPRLVRPSVGVDLPVMG